MTLKKWLTLGIVLFIAYAMISTYYPDKETLHQTKEKAKDAASLVQNSEKTAQFEGSLLDKKVSTILSNVINTEKGYELLSKIVVPVQEGAKAKEESVQITDTIDGAGEGAVCGQDLLIHYSIALPNGKKVINTRIQNEPLTLRLGKGEVIPGLERGLIGLKRGGTRKIIIPGHLAYDGKRFSHPLVPSNNYVTAEVDLLRMNPPLVRGKAFSQLIDTKPGKGNAIVCGQTVKVHLVIRKVDNSEIISTKKLAKPLTVTLGDRSLPLGLTEALQYMRKEGERMVVMSPDWFQTLEKKEPEGLLGIAAKSVKNQISLWWIEVLEDQQEISR